MGVFGALAKDRLGKAGAPLLELQQGIKREGPGAERLVVVVVVVVVVVDVDLAVVIERAASEQNELDVDEEPVAAARVRPARLRAILLSAVQP